MPTLLEAINFFVHSLTVIWGTPLRLFIRMVALFNPPRDQPHRDEVVNMNQNVDEVVNINPDILYNAVALEEGRFMMVPAGRTTPVGEREINKLHVYFFGLTAFFGAAISISFAVNDPRTRTLYKVAIPCFFVSAGFFVYDDLISPVTRLWRRRLVYSFVITAIAIVSFGGYFIFY